MDLDTALTDPPPAHAAQHRRSTQRGPAPIRRQGTVRVAAGLLLAVVMALLLPVPVAQAAVTVSRAEVDRGSLRIEGRALANRAITVDAIRMGTSGSSGSFRISRTGYTPPADCTVDVNDGSATAATVRLTGCTVSTAPTAPAPSTAVILPDTAELGPFRVGAQLPTTVVNFAGSVGPTQWAIAQGVLPDGLSLVVPEPDGRPRPPEDLTYAEIRGTPTRAQTTLVSFRVTDSNGLTATRTYTVRVEPALTLTITPQPWPPARVGEFVNFWIDGGGGLRPYTWAVTGGALPPGMVLIQDTTDGPSVRAGGTPTTAGTFTWTLQLTDAQGATTSRTFTATVEPATAPAPTPAALSVLSVSPTAVTGGSSATGTVALSAGAPADGAVVTLTSSNPQAAAVPASVTVPAGATSATFPVTTSTVAATTSVTLSGAYAGAVRSATLSVTTTAPAPTPAVGTVTISRAEYDSDKRELRVDASSSTTGVTLRVHVTATNALIGTLNGGSGEFTVSSNPQSITVRSSDGSSAVRTVTVK